MRHKSFTLTVYVLLVLALILPIFFQVHAITWSANRKQLTTYTYYDGYPALTQTNDGRIWLVWARELGGNLTLYYKTTSDLGQTWSTGMNLTDPFLNQGQNQNPSIIQAENGTIWVAWTSDRPPPSQPPTPDFTLDASPQNLTIPQGESDNSTIIVTSINDFSETVTLSVLNVPTGVTTVLNPTQVVPPPNDTANSTLTISVNSTATPGNHTLTILGKGDHLLHSIDISLEITATVETSQTNTGARAHTLSLPLKLAAPAVEDYEIYYKVSHDNGATWSTDIQLTDNSVDDLCPSLIQLTNGTFMLFWQTFISGSFNIVYKTTTDGVSWSDLTQLTTDSAPDKGPAATQAKDGRIWVVWASQRTGDYEIYYKIYEGFSWSNNTRLTNSTNSDINPTILHAVDGAILIFWASSTVLGTHDIYYKVSLDNGFSWSGEVEFFVDGYENLWPAIVQTFDTKIWVAWMSNEADQPNGNWEIYCKTSLAGDVNEDNIVDALDLTIVSNAFGASEGHPEYNPDADINKNGIVDIQDLAIVAYHIGET